MMRKRDNSVIMQRNIFLFFLFSIFCLTTRLAIADTSYKERIAYPADAGHLNVRDFGAKGDGITDDTAAINAALEASGADLQSIAWKDKIVYIPNGTYLVKNPIEKRYADGRYASGFILIGESRDNTIIRLQDNSPGYDNEARPKPIIFTASKLLSSDPNDGGRDYKNKGEGNDAYLNTIENVTIDAGKNNPGAIGIDYLANNLGAIRNVTIKAPIGSGKTGIALIRKWPGPALLQNTRVEGFDVGIDVAQTEYGITMEDIILKNQRYVALRNDKNVLSIHNLKIEQAPIPIQNKHPYGLIVITQGEIIGSQDVKVENKGYLNLRGIKLKDYQNFLGYPISRSSTLDGIYKLNERISPSEQPWSLPIKYPPKDILSPIDSWVNVEDYGALPDSNKDSTEGIKNAFSSGRPVVYFPHGTYLINQNITVPASVKHIIGMTSTLTAHPLRNSRFKRENGMLRAANTNSPLTIERITFDHTNLGNQVGIEAIGDQPLIIRDVLTLGVTMLTRRAGAGEIFLENVCCGPIKIQGNKGVWARQLNSEGKSARITNNGSPLWILGLKTERNTLVIKNTGGAITELLGGLIYMVEPVNGSPVAAFSNQNSKIFLSYVEEAFSPKNTYAVHLLNKNSGPTIQTTRDMLIPRDEGRIVPLLIGD